MGLLWRLSNTMEADFCIEAPEEALSRFGRPGIFNTDRGSQFTSPRFSQVLLEPIGNIPPAEAEERYYAMLGETAMAA
jgi:transposase InsO family protein